MDKKCYFCGKNKEINKNNFGEDKSMPDGYRNFCKDCSKVWDKYYKAIANLKEINSSFKMKGNPPYNYNSRK